MLYQRLRYFRTTKRLTQEKLAALSGVSRNIIAKYERNEIEKPNPAVILKIASALSVTPQRLLPRHNDSKDLFEYFVKPKNFGSRLRYLRLKAQIQQRALAGMLKVNRETVRRYENNITAPDGETIGRLAKVLRVTKKALTEKEAR